MDHELRAYLEALEGRLATRSDLADLRQDLGAMRADVTGQFLEVRRELRGVAAAVERAELRLDQSIRSWKEESSLALRRIERLTGRVGRLTRRVRLLEQRGR